MRKPNSFIIGAPKCGTTSLAHYLSEHDEVFFCDPKEPFFWSTDYPELRRKERLESEQDYLALFAKASDQHVAVCEGSTTYLSSTTAVENIRRFNPDARFIAILRDSIDAVCSFHSELVYTSNEDVQDFEQAWLLQDDRADGRHIPKLCRERRWLQYREMGCYAPQIRRFFDLVPESQRKVILFDDIAADIGQVYRDVLHFLGLRDDQRSTFPQLKQSRAHRFESIHRFFRVPPRLLEAPVVRVRRFVARQRSGPVALLKKCFVVSKSRPPLRPEFRSTLIDEFRADVHELEQLLGRKLSHWNSNRTQ